MANVSVRMSFSFEDLIGVPASLILFGTAVDTVTAAQLKTDLISMENALHAISDDGIVSSEIAILFDPGTDKIPGSDSVSEQGLNLNFNQTVVSYAYGVWIPSVKDALIVDGKVDLTASEITDFTTIMADGLAHVSMLSNYQNDVETLRNAAESFRKLRRRASKVTRSIPS
jgi:hypothetical protein